ncbi:MAG: sugar phosphate isomerase/epimerase [Clostridia bacterium]|nr:sugar phosphate isomerase/epimerase [Clostridia bacterium]MBQ4623920.1 sugar phosphate isomerase/epimerase [Clostridia bacterium]
MKFPLGIMADSLRLPIWDAVIKSAELGANGVQIYAVGGEFCFENIPDTKRSQYKSLLGDLGISISALCGDFGGHGFQIPADNPKRLRESRKVMDLAVSLDCKVVTTHIGAIPHDRNSERYAILHEAATKLGAIGESYGGVFAIETGPEEPERLKQFLDDVGSKGMGVNYDPANLVMVTGSDPVKGVYTLKDYIVHTHAKDGLNLVPCDPDIIYGPDAPDILETIAKVEYFREVPLGEGAVDLPGWLKALEDIGYEGFVTIERELGEDPIADIQKAVSFLKTL